MVLKFEFDFIFCAIEINNDLLYYMYIFTLIGFNIFQCPITLNV